MTIAGLLAFAGIYVAAVASPGPGIAAIVARALGRGLTGMAFFIAGFVAGDLTLMVLAATGLALVVKTFASLLLAVKLAGAAYLVFLAWKLWSAGPDGAGATEAPSAGESPLRLFFTTYSLTVGNPKAIIFFIAILPSIVDLKTVDALKVAEIGAMIVCLMPCVLLGYALAAARARQFFTEAASVRLVNRATAVVMVGAAAAVASS